MIAFKMQINGVPVSSQLYSDSGKLINTPKAQFSLWKM